VAKFKLDGTIVYSTYFGGGIGSGGYAGDDFCATVAIDDDGIAWIAGVTSSTDFPLVAPLFDDIPCNERGNACWGKFVTGINPAGDTLDFSSYLGFGVGTVRDEPRIAIDGAGNKIIGCTTGGGDRGFFPTRHPIQAELSGIFDAAILKIGDAPPVDPPVISSVTGKVKNGALAKLKLSGSNLQSGIQVFVGDDSTPWPSAKLKGTTSVTLKGAGLDAKFPAGTAVSIRVHNPDGGDATTSYTRP